MPGKAGPVMPGLTNAWDPGAVVPPGLLARTSRMRAPFACGKPAGGQLKPGQLQSYPPAMFSWPSVCKRAAPRESEIQRVERYSLLCGRSCVSAFAS